MPAPDASWYDAGYGDPGHRARRPLARSPWRPVYEAAARLVPGGARVVDLGSGTGRFASLLPGAGYLGLDFSAVAVAEARRYAPAHEFRVADLREIVPPPADVYVTLEVLEHLDDDLALLARLQAGALVVLSVPSYDSAAHVRHFPAARHVRDRYGSLLPGAELRAIPVGGRGRRIYLMHGRMPTTY